MHTNTWRSQQNLEAISCPDGEREKKRECVCTIGFFYVKLLTLSLPLSLSLCEHMLRPKPKLITQTRRSEVCVCVCMTCDHMILIKGPAQLSPQQEIYSPHQQRNKANIIIKKTTTTVNCTCLRSFFCFTFISFSAFVRLCVWESERRSLR